LPDYPSSVLAATAVAIHRAACPLRDDPDHDCARDAAGEEMFIPRARAALEAAAPLLAEAVAAKITGHMETRGPRKPRGPLESDLDTGRQYRAWRRHFGIAARIAAGAFDTREDHLRKAAEAVARGDFIACNPPEVPGGD
jgi:hypothetical protein